MLGRKIGEGAMSEVFLYDSDKVIKLYRTDNGCADLEYRNGVIAWNMGITTPRPYERITVNNRPGIVYDYIAGRELTEELLRDPEPQARKMAGALFDFNRAVTGDSPELSGLLSLEACLRHDLDINPMLSKDEKFAIFEHFSSLPRYNHLYHGDFNPTNLLLANGRIYVVDLLSLSVGNPLADVMQMILLYKYKVIPDRFPDDIKTAFYRCRQTILTGFTDEYLSLSGFTYSQLQAFFIPAAAMQSVKSDIDGRERTMLLRDLRLELRNPCRVDIGKCCEIPL